ncbi:hypothetical protein GCM10009760_59830 [Kitasatospora kazusensis]|uniref:DUF7847 domain-containing protein n=1 Tax=Kitasatospora kazusensis TaxID=407974 RepID=A0ABP5LZV7_9ACTN
MTDAPGWTSPGSPEPADEAAAGPSAPPSPDAAAPDAAQDAAPQAAPQDVPPPHHPGWGTPGPYSGAPYGGPAYGAAAYPGQQPYPHPGQFHPGWGAPPSPKPGVIPLRPLGVGEILDGAVSTVRKHWRTALGLSFGVAVVEQAITALGELWQFEQPQAVLPLVIRLSAIPVSILLGIIAAGLLTMVVSKAVVGENTTIGAAWRTARPRLPKLVGLTGLMLLITVGILLLSALPLIGAALADTGNPGLLLLLCLPVLAGGVVAVWINVQLSFAAPVLMLEKQGVIASLSRSRRLVKGSWWRIFGITLLGQFLMFVVAAIIATPFSLIGVALAVGGSTGDSPLGGLGGGTAPAVVLLTSIGGVIAATLTIPVQAGIGVLLYVDQRIRREALDIELSRAAGLPEQNNPGWTGSGPVVPGQSGPQGI